MVAKLSGEEEKEKMVLEVAGGIGTTDEKDTIESDSWGEIDGEKSRVPGESRERGEAGRQVNAVRSGG